MPHDHEDEFIALQAALAGEYSLDRELGRGGMGVVYLAREVRLARPVAIKATERLAATVAAIENIRLDLLRLQMGSTGIESVTASLDAARRIGDTPVSGVPAARG